MSEGTAVVQVDERRAEIAGFDSPGAVTVSGREVGAVAQSARGEAEIKAAIVLARNFPRDENAAYAKIMRSGSRPSFAEGARYSFPRGGAKVEGPSVKLAREIKRCWGNMDSGVRLLSIDEDYVHIQGYAVDFETNAWVRAEDKFEKKVFRKKGGWVEPDERDLRELVFRRGSILERNCILQLMPPDIVDEAQRATKETMRKAAAGEIKQDREAAIRRIALAFQGHGVTTEMLSGYLGHPLAMITEDELVELRDIYTSIRDGQSRPDEHFGGGRGRSDATNELNSALKQNGDAPATEGQSHSDPPAEEQEASEPRAKATKAAIAKLRTLRERVIQGSEEGLAREDREGVELAITDADGAAVASWTQVLSERLGELGV